MSWCVQLPTFQNRCVCGRNLTPISFRSHAGRSHCHAVPGKTLKMLWQLCSAGALLSPSLHPRWPAHAWQLWCALGTACTCSSRLCCTCGCQVSACPTTWSTQPEPSPCVPHSLLTPCVLQGSFGGERSDLGTLMLHLRCSCTKTGQSFFLHHCLKRLLEKVFVLFNQGLCGSTTSRWLLPEEQCFPKMAAYLQ